MGASQYDLGVKLVADDDMQQLNAAYRNVNEPTDILSFPDDEEVC